MSTAFVVIENGQMTEHSQGDPREMVGCHGIDGQTLMATRPGDGTVMRMIGCDCALLFPEDHPTNELATRVVSRLGFDHPGMRGRVALVRLDSDGYDVPLTDRDLIHLRALVELSAS